MSTNFQLGWDVQKTGNYEEAVKYCELAVNEGHQGARFHLNCMYFGQGIPQQMHRTVDWDEIPLNENDISELKTMYLELIHDKIIQNNLGLLHAVYLKDEATAFMYYMMSANQGYDMAQYNVAFFHENDKFLKQDYRAVYRWYLLSANQGYCIAQFRLGKLYYNGTGVQKDYNEALKWFTLSADQGYEFAEYNLGNLYSNLELPFLNYQTALKYYKLASSHGHHISQEIVTKLLNLNPCIEIKLLEYITLDRNEGISYLFFCNFLAFLTEKVGKYSWSDPLLRSYITEHFKKHFKLESCVIDSWFDDFY